LRELDESDQCLASSCTIKDMIEQSSGSGSGLPLLVCIGFIMLSVFMCVTAVIGVVEEFLLRLRCSPLYIKLAFGFESMGGNGVLKMSALMFLNFVVSSRNLACR